MWLSFSLLLLVVLLFSSLLFCPKQFYLFVKNLFSGFVSCCRFIFLAHRVLVCIDFGSLATGKNNNNNNNNNDNNNKQQHSAPASSHEGNQQNN